MIMILRTTLPGTQRFRFGQTRRLLSRKLRNRIIGYSINFAISEQPIIFSSLMCDEEATSQVGLISASRASCGRVSRYSHHTRGVGASAAAIDIFRFGKCRGTQKTQPRNPTPFCEPHPKTAFSVLHFLNNLICLHPVPISIIRRLFILKADHFFRLFFCTWPAHH